MWCLAVLLGLFGREVRVMLFAVFLNMCEYKICVMLFKKMNCLTTLPNRAVYFCDLSFLLDQIR